VKVINNFLSFISKLRKYNLINQCYYTVLIDLFFPPVKFDNLVLIVCEEKTETKILLILQNAESSLDSSRLLNNF